MDGFKLGKYRHFKGGLYEAIGLGKHSETMEEVVVYRPLNPSSKLGECSFWVRPKALFLDDAMLDGRIVKRFEYLGTNLD